MSMRHSAEARPTARLGTVTRLLGGFRVWLDEEIHAIRAAQLDDAFFATAKGVQYRPHFDSAPDGRLSAS